MTSVLFPFVRAVRGPVVLITLGVLFAIDQMQGIAFRRTWPVLLVVFGVMKLIERLLAPPAPVYYPPAAGAPAAWAPPPPQPPPPGGYQS